MDGQSLAHALNTSWLCTSAQDGPGVGPQPSVVETESSLVEVADLAITIVCRHNGSPDWNLQPESVMEWLICNG